VTPVVVELFESQGCSSCPPSEGVMKALAKEFGPSVILLTFHVDYWDYLGWKDTFSDPRWTERQKYYGQAFQQDSIYTPEMVVQGESGFVGSNLSRARSEVQRRVSAGRLAFSLKAARGAEGIHVTAQFPPDLAAKAGRLTLVRVENSAYVQVLRGENRGETMSGDFAVRDIAIMPAPHEGRSAQILHATSSGPTRVAVLVADSRDAIIAAQVLDVP
jgi:hypothetical protein